MNYNALYLGLAVLAALFVGTFAGSQLFPTEVVETELQVIEVTKEVPVEVVKIEEVFIEDTEKISQLEYRIGQLAQRYEQLVGKEFNADTISRELALIERATVQFEAEYKHLVLRGFTPSQVTFTNWYNQDVVINTVDVIVNGVEREYDEVTVTANTRVRYSNSDSTNHIRWEIVMHYWLDSNGVEQVDVSASRI